MRRNTRNWLILGGVAGGLVLAALLGAGWYLSRQLEPFVRGKTVSYLSQRFNGQVALQKFEVSMPIRDPLKVLLNKGRGARLKVRASGILLRQTGAREGYPLLRLKGLTFELDMSKLLDSPALIDVVHLDGLELALPPKGERNLRAPEKDGPEKPADAPGGAKVDVLIERIVADGTKLVILPKDPAKAPLQFDLYRLTLESAGAGVAMKYVTTMKNAKPPGVIECRGTFGPFKTKEPGETPLTGDYVFRKADLAVFKGIAGLLDSTGKFSGKLDEIVVDGETTVPDFRLPAANNRMMLKTKFHAIVDGTNGNTRLEPVEALLGSSPIRCHGGVVRFPGENGKTVDLDCSAKGGKLDEFLLLAMKGNRPAMTGRVDFDVKILVPPDRVPYAQKLRLSGPFKLTGGAFTSKDVQAKLDDMSRRAQGKPSDMSITGATSDFSGRMGLNRQMLNIDDLIFRVEGAAVRLSGQYDLKNEVVDFHGQLRTDARLSEMMKTGWKRIALKPVDPFFAKDGAGAQFDIAITGPASSPKFGLDKKDNKSKAK
jgi:hypothetical protein